MTGTPGALRVVWLLARLATRRWANRVFSGVLFKKKEGRTGTARKGRGGTVWLIVAGALFLFSGVNVSFQFLLRLSDGIDRRSDDGRTAVGPGAHWFLERVDGEGPDALVKLRKDLEETALWQDEVPKGERASRAEQIVRRYEKEGLAGFRRIDRPRGRIGPETIPAAGAVLFLLALAQVWLALGTQNQDLGRVEWSLEWLFTFPAPAGRLFLAKVFEFAFVNPFGWFMIFPFLLTYFWSAGHEWAALPIAAAASLALALVLASIRLLAETGLRMRLSFDRLKNVQALCTLVGTCLWLGLLWISISKTTPDFFLDFAARLPAAALWNPLSLPVLSAEDWRAPAALAAFAVLFPMGAVFGCRHWVRDGLLTSSGTFQGSRRRAPAGPERRPLFRGVIAKDLRLLIRDRNFLIGTLVVPVLVFAFQVVLYPDLLKGVTGDFRHAATLAFGLGSYILMSSAFQVLTIEGGSLWLLYTFPRELHSILLQKTLVWAGVAIVYAGIALGVTAAYSRALNLQALWLGATALVGVMISAFAAAALGALASDPLQQDPQRKVRAEVLYLYMLLAGMFGFAIYGPSAWTRLVTVVLASLLVLALWQKVRDRLPYLLDPTEAPPPRIALSDGLVSVLLFFVLQGLVAAAASKVGLPFGPTLLLAYVGAGAVVTLLTLYVFWRLKVPRLFEAVGFRSPEGSIGRSLVVGPLAGLAAALAALAYLIAAQKIAPLREFMEESVKESGLLRQGGIGWFQLLAVVAAPLFEEYLFRGLVYKGMRRSMKPALAIVASAAIFAIVHPPAGFLPVFGLGIVTAIAFERTGLLLAPILAHVVYNAAVVLVSRG